MSSLAQYLTGQTPPPETPAPAAATPETAAPKSLSDFLRGDSGQPAGQPAGVPSPADTALLPPTGAQNLSQYLTAAPELPPSQMEKSVVGAGGSLSDFLRMPDSISQTDKYRTDPTTFGLSQEEREYGAKKPDEMEDEPWYSKAWEWLNSPLYDLHKWGTREGAGTFERGLPVSAPVGFDCRHVRRQRSRRSRRCRASIDRRIQDRGAYRGQWGEGPHDRRVLCADGGRIA